MTFNAHDGVADTISDPSCTAWTASTEDPIRFALKRYGADAPIQLNTKNGFPSFSYGPSTITIYPGNVGRKADTSYESCRTADGLQMYRRTNTIYSTKTVYTETIYPTSNGKLRYHINFTGAEAGRDVTAFESSIQASPHSFNGTTSYFQTSTDAANKGLFFIGRMGTSRQNADGNPVIFQPATGTRDIVLDIAGISNANERLVNLDANGGTMPDGTTAAPTIINSADISTLDWTPTRPGYRLKGWTVNKDGTGGNAVDLKTAIKDNQTLYAQWEKETGKPTAVHISCANGGTSTCAVSTDYADAESRTRTLTTSATGANLAWDQYGPIDGVLLDDSGYRARSSCVPMSSGPAKCYWVSLREKPDATANVNLTTMPTTGAPTGLSLIGLVASGICLAGVMLMLVRRRD